MKRVESSRIRLRDTFIRSKLHTLLPSNALRIEIPPTNTISFGHYAQITKTFADEHVFQFANLVGDFNPVHFDQNYIDTVMKDKFQHKLVHGMLVGSLISTIAGTILPGKGSIYLSQQFQFKKPVYIGNTVTAYVCCKGNKGNNKHVFLFDTWIYNETTKEDVILGEAMVYHQQRKFE